MQNNSVTDPSDSPDSSVYSLSANSEKPSGASNTATPSLRRKQKDAVRLSILESASRLVAQGGAEALSLRKVAEEVGASTMVVYTAFGSKEGLLDALWVEGFRRLWELEESALKLSDPMQRLRALGQAYRRNALKNPYFYKLVFGGQLPKCASGEEDLACARTFEVLIEAVAACQQAGFLTGEISASDIAAMLWSAAHGAISLELADMFEKWADGEKIYEQNFDCLIRGLK